jgi:hypothetical protein
MELFPHNVLESHKGLLKIAAFKVDQCNLLYVLVKL